jgi:hypothetical protein
MHRINFHHIKDTLQLSSILDQILLVLVDSDLKVTPKSLSYDTEINELTFDILRNLKNTPDWFDKFSANDFHAVLSSILFRYPTLKIWKDANGDFFFEV